MQQKSLHQFRGVQRKYPAFDGISIKLIQNQIAGKNRFKRRIVPRD